MSDAFALEFHRLAFPPLVLGDIMGITHGAGGQQVPILAGAVFDLLMDLLPDGEEYVPALVGLDPPDHANQVVGEVGKPIQPQLGP